ncbi:unnamed protein product, partial [Mycena citricolor]
TPTYRSSCLNALENQRPGLSCDTAPPSNARIDMKCLARCCVVNCCIFDDHCEARAPIWGFEFLTSGYL